ncbi:MAG: hypothetical protein D6B28_01835 [Gammaproteobacteria bacterium]|nr:MAG: hypothetical protein D6B28_01835 [Gammaproteobacteria bacterium]
MENGSGWLTAVSNFEHFVCIFNILIFIFSKKITTTLSKGKDESTFRNKLWSLRFINLVLLTLYIISVVLGHLALKDANTAQVIRNISQTGLVLLLMQIVSQLSNYYCVVKYGREKEIEDEKVVIQTYQSEVFALINTIIIFIAAFLIIINIWDMTELLQVTSVVGGLAIIAFSTKEVWAPDNINGLILLYNGNIESGSIVRVKELDLLAIVIRTTLTQTVFRDLALRHQVVIPNSKFRNTKIEILNCSATGAIRQYIDFNISYQTDSNKVEKLFAKVWELAIGTEEYYDTDRNYNLKVIETGNHAVTWRLFYSVQKIYKMNDARFLINRIALDESIKTGIGLDTPITHSVTMNK